MTFASRRPRLQPVLQAALILAALVLVGPIPAAAQEQPPAGPHTESSAGSATTDPPMTAWLDAGKHDLTDGGHVSQVDVTCGNLDPRYAFLVPDEHSYAYRLTKIPDPNDNAITVTVNPDRSSEQAGRLALDVDNFHPSGNYAVQVQVECVLGNQRWMSSGKIDLRDSGPTQVDVACRDGTPEGEVVPYPYLVPENYSVAYRTHGTDNLITVYYDMSKTNPVAGWLTLHVYNAHWTGDYAIQVDYLCSAEYPYCCATTPTIIYADGVTDVTSSSATLEALVRNRTTDTVAYWAEYGTQHARYTSSTPKQTFKSAKEHDYDTVVQAVSIKLDNLLPGTTYHYRLATMPCCDHVSYSGPDLTFTTDGVATPTSAPTVKWWAQHAPLGTKWKANTQVRYAVSFVAPEGEGGLGPWGPWGGTGWALGHLIDIPTDASGKATSRKIYRQFEGGQPEVIGTLNNNTDTEYQDDNY
jgi:hypothetical protein